METGGARRDSDSTMSSVYSVEKTKPGMGGYEPPDIHVSEAQIRGAKAISSDIYRLKELLAEEITQEACEHSGISSAELLPKDIDEFRLEVGRARVVPRHVQKKRYNHFESRRVWKLAAVLAQRDKRMAVAARTAKAKRATQVKMVEAYSQMMNYEQERLTREAIATEKVTKAIITENNMLVKRREEAEVRAKVVKERHRRQKATRDTMLRLARERAAEKEAETKELIKQHREMEDVERQMKAEEQACRRDRLAEFELEQKDKHNKFMRRRAVEERRRADVRARVKAQDGLYRKYVSKSLSKKSSKTQSLLDMRDEAIAARKEDRRIQFEVKLENAERLRQIKLLKKRDREAKIAQVDARLNHMKQVRAAVEEERKLKMKMDRIDRDSLTDGIVMERKVKPGPGTYDPPPSKLPNNGQWGHVKTKSMLDQEVERAAKVPGPADYSAPEVLRTDRGVRFSTAPVSNMLAPVMEAAAKIPGPGDYEVIPKSYAPKIQFDEGRPTSFLDKLVKDAGDVPGPGAYAKPTTSKPIPKLFKIEKEMKRAARELGMIAAKSPMVGGRVRGRPRPPVA